MQLFFPNMLMHTSFLLQFVSNVYRFISQKSDFFKTEHVMSLLIVKKVLIFFTHTFVLIAYDANFLAH